MQSTNLQNLPENYMMKFCSYCPLLLSLFDADGIPHKGYTML